MSSFNVTSRGINGSNSENLTIVQSLERNKLFIYVNNDRVEVNRTKTPKIRGEVTSIVNTKQFVTKFMKPKS